MSYEFWNSALFWKTPNVNTRLLTGGIQEFRTEEKAMGGQKQREERLCDVEMQAEECGWPPEAGKGEELILL